MIHIVLIPEEREDGEIVDKRMLQNLKDTGELTVF